MNVNIPYYLAVVSPWCHWAEPAWAELKRRYVDRVEFGWKIAQVPVEVCPVSKAQCEWFYRLNGSIIRSPYMLNSDWFGLNQIEMLMPNLVAETTRDSGVNDDRVRLAIAQVAVREGRKIGRWTVAVTVAAKTAERSKSKLLARARSRASLPASKSPPMNSTRCK